MEPSDYEEFKNVIQAKLLWPQHDAVTLGVLYEEESNLSGPFTASFIARHFFTGISPSASIILDYWAKYMVWALTKSSTPTAS